MDPYSLSPHASPLYKYLPQRVVSAEEYQFYYGRPPHCRGEVCGMPLNIGLTVSKWIQHLFFLSFTWLLICLYSLRTCAPTVFPSVPTYINISVMDAVWTNLHHNLRHFSTLRFHPCSNVGNNIRSLSLSSATTHRSAPATGTISTRLKLSNGPR